MVQIGPEGAPCTPETLILQQVKSSRGVYPGNLPSVCQAEGYLGRYAVLFWDLGEVRIRRSEAFARNRYRNLDGI